MTLQEYAKHGAEALRSSERMMRQNIELWKDTPEESGDYYDAEWLVCLSQEEAATLTTNLANAAKFLDLVADDAKGAA